MAETSNPPDAGNRRQHFLLSAAARGLSLIDIARLDEDDAYRLFCGVRWPESHGEPICPHCDSPAVVKHKSRRIFTCKACGRQFSATSGTPFHGRKLPMGTILFAISNFTNGAKGYSALQLSRDIDCQYKTAFVLLHKLREAIQSQEVTEPLSGVLEADGVHIGGHVRPTNWAENRKDRRLRKNQNGKRRVVTALRQRGGRTWVTVHRSEADGAAAIEKMIAPGAELHVDEARSWDPLHYVGIDIKRINHEEAYSDGTASTNNVESFFSRIRRAEHGIHHHISGPYLKAYASEMAWREDARRIDNRTQFLMIAMATATFGPSRRMRGYWQRHLKLRSSSGSSAS
jgi:transposase-like protein